METKDETKKLADILCQYVDPAGAYMMLRRMESAGLREVDVEDLRTEVQLRVLRNAGRRR